MHEIITGTRAPSSASASSIPSNAAFALRVSCCVSTSSTSAFPSTSPSACSRNVATSSGNVIPPVTLIAFVVGPMEPATKRGRSGVEREAATRFAISAARRLISRAESPSPYSASTIGVPPNVFVSTMSAPASK